MPHERGIEQCRRFQRILLGEVRSQKQSAIFTQRSVGEEVAFDGLESLLEERLRFLMTPVEFLKYVFNLLVDFLFRQRTNASDHAQNAVIARRLERSQDDSLLVGRKNDSGSFNWQVMFSVRGGFDIRYSHFGSGRSDESLIVGLVASSTTACSIRRLRKLIKLGNDSHGGTKSSHFDERKEKGKCRLGTLVLVDLILHQAIETTSRRGVVDRFS